MLAALQDRTQYRPTTDSALMKWIVRHAAWLIPRFRGNDVQSPFYRATGGPYRGKLLEFGESVLAHLPEVGKDLGIPHRSWLTDGNPLCGWARATSQTSIWLELTKELCHSVRRLAEQSWSEEDLRAVVETPQRPKTPTADIQFAAEPLALLHAPEDDKEEPTAEHEEDEEMQGKPLDTKETPGVSSSGRGEKRTETQENMSVKKRVMMKSPKRPATPVSPPDDPVKR